MSSGDDLYPKTQYNELDEVISLTCEYIFKEAELLGITPNKPITCRRVEAFFYEQYYEIKNMVFGEGDHSDLFDTMLKTPKDVSQEAIYNVHYHKTNINRHNVNTTLHVSSVKYADGIIERTTTKKEQIKNTHSSDQTNDKETRRNIRYYHTPFPEFDAKYARFFQSFIKDFFESTEDCEESWRYPWPPITVEKRDSDVFLTYKAQEQRM